jgi:hypothetical protein
VITGGIKPDDRAAADNQQTEGSSRPAAALRHNARPRRLPAEVQQTMHHATTQLCMHPPCHLLFKLQSSIHTVHSKELHDSIGWAHCARSAMRVSPVLTAILQKHKPGQTRPALQASSHITCCTARVAWTFHRGELLAPQPRAQGSHPCVRPARGFRCQRAQVQAGHDSCLMSPSWLSRHRCKANAEMSENCKYIRGSCSTSARALCG